MESIKQKVSEISVIYNYKQPASDRPKISCAASGFIHLRDGYELNTIGIQEQFVVMYLNQSNRVLGIYRASTGGITGTIADIRLILSVALKIGATSMLVSHNHPSGNLSPSRSDEELTKKMKESAAIMDIRLLDHLIIHPDCTQFYSFAEEGLM